jgi:uncharacterized protein YjbJ (UPF0337 family)
MSDKNTSTLQSYIDSASGAVQSAIGSLTGNASDQVCLHLHLYPLSSSSASHTNTPQNAGEAKKDKAQLENEASHATAKIGNYTASSSGAITKDDPNRTDGSWNQTIGSAKETIGNLVGSEVPLPSPLFIFIEFY